ncbi:MAG: protein-disulfide reductase DsbD N-terminal domain-containing protein [Gemmataceae bacterium]
MVTRTLVVLVVFSSVLLAQGKKSDTAVKVSATSATAGTNRVINLTLEIDPKYYIYANPIDNKDFADNQTTVTASKGKLLKVHYPKGERVPDKIVGDYSIYKGKVTIEATVEGTGPVELAITLQACSKTSCLLPATIKVNVP